jgi:CDP-diacylglycerol--glycerol-3-phosphate 3-phosphatidyltransferase
VFVAAAGTDWLDGWIARRRGEVSVFGRMADPLVDKLLVLGALVFLLAIPGVATALPPWVALVILVRELIVTAMRGAVEAAGGNFQAGVWGKAKMVLQCCAVGAAILHGAGVSWMRAKFPDPTSAPAVAGECSWAMAISVLAGIATAVSGVEYVMRGVRALDKKA